MPKRSNDFQKLVRLVQQAFAPAGATVEESVLVENQGAKREIDVLIKSDLGLYKIKIAVEVKDHARPLGPQCIEEYIGKYRQGDGIPVNQVVIVSSAGFTRSAKDKARAAKIELLTLTEAKTADWRKYIPPEAPQKLRFGIAPHLHRLTFFPPVAANPEKIMQDGRLICDCCGKDHGEFRQQLEKWIKLHLFENTTYRDLLQKSLKEHNGQALATLNLSLRKRALLLGDLEFPIDGLSVEIHFCEAEADMQVTTYDQTDLNGTTHTIQHAQAIVAGKKVQFVLPDGLRSKKIVVDISDAPNCSQDANTPPQRRRRAG